MSEPLKIVDPKKVETPEQALECGLTVFSEKAMSILKHDIDERRRIRHIQILLGSDIQIIPPPASFDLLHALVESNNTIPDCIEALRVNVDGTGFKIKPKSGKEEDIVESEVEFLTSLFDEFWPKHSITEIRKDQRYERETLGNTYLEVARNPFGDITVGRRLKSKSMFLVELDEPIDKQTTVKRGDVDLVIEIPVSERRFVQVLNRKSKAGGQKAVKGIFYKEFGSTRDLDKDTGEWHAAGALSFNKRASEVIHFKTAGIDTSPYGMPRWWHKLISVLGSREADELNLIYFKKGGIPPALITISGGKIAQEGKKELDAMLKGKADEKLVMAVLSAFPTTGGIDDKSSVKIEVHRFGAEQQKDALFQDYDARTNKKVKDAYRIPGIFLGQSDEETFATAYVSYFIGEEQIFAPEREDFDRPINDTIMPEFFDGKYIFVSNPMPIRNPELHMNAVVLASNKKLITPLEELEQMNKITGLNMQGREGLENLTPEDLDPVDIVNPLESLASPTQTLRMMGKDWITVLAVEYLKYSGLDGLEEDSEVALEDLQKMVDKLSPADRTLFRGALAETLHGDASETAIDCCTAASGLISGPQ